MSSSNDLATVRIARFDRAGGDGPYWQVFENVPYVGRRVLDVLTYLMQHVDSSLGFRQSCRAGLCAACNVRVNGKTVLACKRLAEREMTIEPPKHMPVIKDTVVASTRLSTAGRTSQVSRDVE